MTTHASLNAMVCATVEARAPETVLLERAASDVEAFSTLYERHHEAIYRYLCRRTGDAHDAEDLASEVFLSAMEGIGRYQRTGAPFRAWLYGIATNKANRWARDWRRRRRRPMPIELTGASNGAPEDADLAQAALLTLSPRLQAVVTLHYLEGLGVDEIATVIGRPAGTVKSRLARARTAMRRALERLEQPKSRQTETNP